MERGKRGQRNLQDDVPRGPVFNHTADYANQGLHKGEVCHDVAARGWGANGTEQVGIESQSLLRAEKKRNTPTVTSQRRTCRRQPVMCQA